MYRSILLLTNYKNNQRSNNSVCVNLVKTALAYVCLLIGAPAHPVDVTPTSIDYTMYKLATEMDDAAAQYFIGRKYYLGSEVTENKTEAAKWFRKSATKGYTKAEYMLGKMSLYGEGVDRNFPDAVNFLGKAADAGYADAQYELANYYFLGWDGGKNPRVAVKWYREAAINRHAKARFQLGKILFAGLGVGEDKKEGKKWLELAASSGVEEAIAFLNSDASLPPARTSERGGASSAPKKSSAKSRSTESRENEKLNSEIKQAEKGNVDAQYALAIRYLNADDVTGDAQIAAKWFRKAAEQDHAGAQYQLGIMYRDGIGVAKSESEATKWLRLASSWGVNKAQQDLDSLLRKQLLAGEEEFSANPELSKPDAQYTLGVMYEDGKGVSRDPSTAIQWFLKAAKQNHPEAQYRVGKMYRDGIGVTSNHEEAKLWLAKAADSGLSKASKALEDILKSEQKRILDREADTLKSSPIYPYLINARKGDNEAQYRVGVMFMSGDETPKDVNQGIKWLVDAATNNHLQAQIKLGDIYSSGASSVEPDYSVAAKWYSLAAQKGDAEAQYQLGELYRKGMGVEKDNAQAVKWFRLAAKQGHSRARKQLGGCKIC